MYLIVAESPRCSTHQIRVPKRLRFELGLDYGDWLFFDTLKGVFSVMVEPPALQDIMEHGDRKAFVSEDSPILESKGSEVLIEPHKLTIGADPEIFLIDRRNLKILPAHKILPKEAQVGSDGDLAELRPDYALCPNQLVENVRHLVKELYTKVPNNAFPFAASWYKGLCCGFHVHLGVPIEILSYAADETDKFIRNMVSILDYFVGLPAMAADTDSQRRLSYQYGKPGDYRLSMRTIEYRTPGGFHLRSPEHAKNLFSLAFEVADKIIKYAEKESNNWSEMEEACSLLKLKNQLKVPDEKYVKEILNRKDKRRLNEEALKAINIIKTISTNYADNIVGINHSREPNTLFKEWVKDEEKHQTHFRQEGRSASTDS